MPTECASLGLLALMCKCVGVLFPVPTIEIDDGHVLGNLMQAVDVDIDTVWIRARDIERFDTAGFAEFVLGNAAVECVGLERLFTFKQFEVRRWNY